MTFHECCRAVIAAADARPNAASLQYAASYAKGGLSFTSSEAMRVQALYILNNMAGWRGAEATLVRTALRAIAK